MMHDSHDKQQTGSGRYVSGAGPINIMVCQSMGYRSTELYVIL